MSRAISDTPLSGFVSQVLSHLASDALNTTCVHARLKRSSTFSTLRLKTMHDLAQHTLQACNLSLSLVRTLPCSEQQCLAMRGPSWCRVLLNAPSHALLYNWLMNRYSTYLVVCSDWLIKSLQGVCSVDGHFAEWIVARERVGRIVPNFHIAMEMSLSSSHLGLHGWKLFLQSLRLA